MVDARHGLAGQRLELVSAQSARGHAFVVVRLPDGRRRSIRRSVTDLGSETSAESDVSRAMARISVRTLLTLMRHLNSKVASPIREVIRDERPVESASLGGPNLRATSDAHQNDSAESLAPLTDGDTKADRADTGTDAPADLAARCANTGETPC
ncbi:DUF5372 family protein [Aurantimonas sp. C2-4-R8]|uniref:DUF5372 family protein n=1 Tax=Aurantimonas sp. C2-4-R8 TaxID=3114364 RepID=UPI003FA45DA3